MTAASQTVSLRFLNRAQVESLLPGDDELINVIESGLRAHGLKEVVLPPKAHLVLDHLMNGHFNILSGACKLAQPDSRGFATSDIVLGHAIHHRAKQTGVGTILPLLEASKK
jgi:ornithine cyclodeaminase/alanine dehydrogenase-like protein (mu-crystallin family)